jgi:lysophospholipase L1-like esterase
MLTDRQKGFLVSLATVFLLLILLELLLRILGYADPNTRRDPFYGFDGTPSVFQKEVVADRGITYTPRPSKSFIVDSFPAHKSTNSFRIFTFGGSTTHGEPYGNGGSFSYWLKRYLQNLHPDKNIEVINCGVNGYGSSRVLQIVEEAVNYDPDLFVVYTGQNEFRDARFHYWELTRSPRMARLMSLLFHSRLIYFLHERFLALKANIFGGRQVSYGGSHIQTVISKPFSQETFKTSDYFTVPRLVHAKASTDRSPASRKDVMTRLKQAIKHVLGVAFVEMSQDEVFSNFQNNVERMVSIAMHRDIPIVFLVKAQNPKARNLMWTESHAIRLDSPAKQTEWERRYGDAVEKLQKSQYREAIGVLQEIQQRYGSGNLLSLYLGRAYEALGAYPNAILAYEQRLSPDHLVLNQLLRNVASKYGVPVIDVYELLKENAKNQIVGYEDFFVDNVHMTLEGYELIGAALCRLIQGEGYVIAGSTVPRDCEWSIEQRKNEHARVTYDVIEVQTAQAWASFNQGNLDEALVGVRSVIEQDSANIKAQLLLGYVYAKLGWYVDAQRAYDTLKRLYQTGTGTND